MRDIVLVLALFAALGLTLRFPFVGMLVWAWISLMSPHRLVYGFAFGQPFNLLVAVVTIMAWLVSREPKRLPPGGMPWVMIAYAAWMTFDSFFAPNPDQSWPLWDLTMKGFVFVLLAGGMMTSKARIHAMVWVLVISIGFYGVKGGLFTMVTGGNYRVYGPDSTIIADNNQLAVAVTMILPLVVYLRRWTDNRWLRLGCAVAAICMIATVLGSYSRGGFIALAVTLVYFWARSRNKVLSVAIGLTLAVPALMLMPDSFWERMNTIQDAGSDNSFMGRLISWQVCFQYAVDHFPFGAGFAGTQMSSVFGQYFPDVPARAAHSIYFQALGEHGFIGLGFYLAMMLLAWRNSSAVIRQARNREGMGWAEDLARLIQVGLVAFYVGGAALSMAYYDGYFLLLVVLSALRQLTRPALAASAVAAARGRPEEATRTAVAVP